MLKIKRKWSVEEEYINTDVFFLTKETLTLAGSWVYC